MWDEDAAQAVSNAVAKERKRFERLVISMWKNRYADKSLDVSDVNALLKKMGSKRVLDEP